MSTQSEKESTNILTKGLGVGFDKVLVAGYGTDGKLYVLSSCSHGGDVLWIIAAAQQALLDAAKQETLGAA
jgi:hypothetical protein